jgi:hypothetical protein
MNDWIVVYRDRAHRKISVSRRLATRDDALSEACALIDKGHEPHRLVGPDNEETSREVIEVLYRHGRTGTRGAVVLRLKF